MIGIPYACPECGEPTKGDVLDRPCFTCRTHERKETRGLDVSKFPRPSNQQTLYEIERDAILVTLWRVKGNRTHAAKALDINLRTLRHKLMRYREEGEIVPDADMFRVPVSIGQEDRY